MRGVRHSFLAVAVLLVCGMASASARVVTTPARNAVPAAVPNSFENSFQLVEECHLPPEPRNGLFVSNNPINLWDPLGLCPDDPLLQDPKAQDLINQIWDKSTPFGLSGIGWFGAREHYGFLGSKSGSTTTSGPFPATTSTGGYQPAHQKADPAGTVAGVHSHWSNNPNASKEDKNVAKTRNRPEYIVTKDGITRVNPDGTTDSFKRDGTASNCKCP